MGNSDSKDTSYGYRIIKVAPGSPAQKAGLIEFLDNIIDISSPTDKTPFTGNYGEFFKIIQNSEDTEATLKVYNILYRKARIVTIVPSKKWENSDSLLGALVRYEEYATAHERVLRIAEIHPHSPAAIAGLEADTDYILGSPQYLYSDLNELANFIEMTQEKETIKSLELYVFSAQTNSVRSTLIIPNKNWGGSGHLGCEFALGILNHLPQLEEAIPVSNLGENETLNTQEKIDRLDESPISYNEPLTLEKSLINEERTLEQKVINQQPSINQSHPKPSEDIPDFKLRPPTSAEVEHSKLLHEGQKQNNFDLSHELTNQRMKLLHKVPGKAVPKPVIRSGRSSANPFHNSEDTTPKHGDLALTSPQVSQEHPVHEKSPVAEVVPTKSETYNENIGKQPHQNGFSQYHHQIHDQSSHHHHEQQSNQASHEQVYEKEKHVTKLEALLPDTLEIDKKAQVEEVKQEPEKNKSGRNENVSEITIPSSTEKVAKSPLREKELKSAIYNNEVKVENSEKSPAGIKAQERQAYKTTVEYNFFSKKLSGEYKILSSNLFDVDEPLRAKLKQ